MAGYRNYLLMVLAAYVLLILLLHIQLQGFDKAQWVYSMESEWEAGRRVLHHGAMQPDARDTQGDSHSRELTFHHRGNEGLATRDYMHGSDGKKAISPDKQGDSSGGARTWHAYLLEALGRIPHLREAPLLRDSLSDKWEKLRYLSNGSHSGADKKAASNQYVHKSVENGWHFRNELPSDGNLGAETGRRLGLETVGSVLHPVLPGCDADKPPSEASFQPLLQHFIYTAYYDDRKPGRPLIRIIALMHKAKKPPLSCHFKLPGHKANGSSTTSAPVEFYEMCENHAKEYGGWILSCKVPSLLHSPPCSVQLTAHQSPIKQKPATVTIPVFTLGTNNSPAPVNFSVCVPPLFGTIPSMSLINFIEFTQLLGAQHFVFYNFQVTSEIKQVLEYYAELGIVSVIRWALPVKDKQVWYHGQLAAINDCLYRSMHLFKHVSFNDIDEFLVSRSSKDWASVVEQITKSNHAPLAGFSFQSAFFDPNLAQANQVVYNLETELRTRVTSKVRTKVLVNPRNVFELGIHHISRPLDKRFQVAQGNPKEVLIHHYRKCTSDFDPRMNCQVFIKDTSLSPYIPTGRLRVHQTLWRLQQRARKRATGR